MRTPAWPLLARGSAEAGAGAEGIGAAVGHTAAERVGAAERRARPEEHVALDFVLLMARGQHQGVQHLLLAGGERRPVLPELGHERLILGRGLGVFSHACLSLRRQGPPSAVAYLSRA